jgi:hypothetical protein
MKKKSVQALLKTLNDKGVRYLVVGGLAVNAHGVLRFTADVDLVVQLNPENVKKAFAALSALGYRPTAPVTAEGFADSATREEWVREKGMTVLQFYSDRHRETCVDVFASEPFPFDAEYGVAFVKGMVEGVEVRFVSLETLFRMKEEAGRPKDLADIGDLRLRRDDLEGKA